MCWPHVVLQTAILVGAVLKLLQFTLLWRSCLLNTGAKRAHSLPTDTLYLHRLFHMLQSLDYSLFNHAVFAVKTVFVGRTI